MEPLKQSACKIIKFTALASLALVFATSAEARCHCHQNKEEMNYKAVEPAPAWMPYWYVGGNIGVSDTHDDETIPTSSVKNVGPGWSVDGGYQFTPNFGAEAGFTSYYHSRDDVTATNTNIAITDHYSVDLAATGQYPLIDRLSVLGKLGAAYNYARKQTPFGAYKQANSGSLYGALGLEYSLTKTVDVIGQWARSRGNNQTGSTDLYSIGLKWALV